MEKNVFMTMAVITILGLLLIGCDRVLQTTNPLTAVPEPDMAEPQPVANTGDCISQVGPVTAQGGQRSLQDCLEKESPTPNNEVNEQNPVE
ncbi:hypothetical protein C6503_14905 [Candidatus Poribacteria bacterium]|nr:MAG: hypothetical protein C6503_14905 [Candidatus Poribacteria bacterium]